MIEEIKNRWCSAVHDHWRIEPIFFTDQSFRHRPISTKAFKESLVSFDREIVSPNCYLHTHLWCVNCVSKIVCMKISCQKIFWTNSSDAPIWILTNIGLCNTEAFIFAIIHCLFILDSLFLYLMRRLDFMTCHCYKVTMMLCPVIYLSLRKNSLLAYCNLAWW